MDERRCGAKVKHKHVSGERFASLTLIERVHTPKQRYAWLCLCDCGATTMAFAGDLRSGRMQSCGCKRRETTAKANTTHGLTKSGLYFAWHAMMSRCHNKADASYTDYGARGITVCERWRDVAAFCVDMAPKPRGMSLDRKDNDGPYSPENCRWATLKQQQRNKRTNRLLTAHGHTATIAEWSERTGVQFNTIIGRIKRGWSPERCVL